MSSKKYQRNNNYSTFRLYLKILKQLEENWFQSSLCNNRIFPRLICNSQETFCDKMKSDSMVLFLRLLTSGYLRMNPTKFEDYLDKGTTMEVYCLTEVEPLERECDQVNKKIIEIYLLASNDCSFELLRCPC